MKVKNFIEVFSKNQDFSITYTEQNDVKNVSGKSRMIVLNHPEVLEKEILTAYTNDSSKVVHILS